MIVSLKNFILAISVTRISRKYFRWAGRFVMKSDKASKSFASKIGLTSCCGCLRVKQNRRTSSLHNFSWFLAMKSNV